VRVDAGRTVRHYRLDGGRPRTTGLSVDGVEVPVDGPELALVVDGRRLTDADLDASAVDATADGSRLAWTLGGGADLSVRMVVEADRAAGVVRSRAEVTGRGRLEAVEQLDWPGPTCTGWADTGEPVAYNAGPPGLGQPVFGPGFFAGIEHPAAETLLGAGGRGCRCALPVAVDLGTEPFRTPAAVVGAGGPDDFWDYLDTLRPVPPRLVTLANNWYHLGAPGLMDEAAVVAERDGFERVARRHGPALDFRCLDDGWEGDWEEPTGLWGRMAPTRFPSGLAPLGPGIGLWLSPFGGYGGRCQDRVAWAEAHGLEVEAAAGVLCPAGNRYRRHLRTVLARWTAAGVGYWKLDGVRFACQDPAHGHAVGPGSRTAQVDGFRDLVAGIRAVRPDAVVAFTIGSWPSPWWLGTVDFLWRGGLDDTAADHPGSRLDRFDTYIDCCLQAYRGAALPVSALVTFSVVEAAGASYRDPGPDGLARWARHCWLAVGRGTLHQDLYVAPDSLSEPEWEVLAAALAWARDNQEVLARSRMVLGDPGTGAIYGFAARRGPAATAGLRNPSDRPQSVDCDWASLLGFPAGTALALTARHGALPPDTGRLTMAPFEVLVVEARAG
jgi:hypothetical protein